MAKELPYFKFEPAEWLTGRINLESFEIQGAYINICCVYWQRLGNLSIKEAKLRLKTYYKPLIDSQYITEHNGNINIKFLDIQLIDRKVISNKRAKAGAKGGKANAKQLQSNCKAEEKRIEKNRKEENKKEDSLFLEKASTYRDRVMSELKITLPEYLRQLNIFSIANDMSRDEKELKKHFFNWLKQQDSKQQIVKNIKPKFDPYG